MKHAVTVSPRPFIQAPVLSVRRSARVLPAFAVVAMGGAMALTFGACADEPVMSTPSLADQQMAPAAVSNSKLVTLVGNTPFSARLENSVGRLEEDYRMEYMQLVLQRPADVEAKLEAAIDALHDKTSPTYGQWMKPADMDAWGPADADIATVRAWLESNGFRIDRVPPGKMWIEFSGNAGQINKAFHTEMHRLVVNGHPHISNIRDPQIPAELTKTVVGVHALHDFRPHPMHKKRGAVALDRKTGSWSPAAGLPSVGPRPDDTFPDTPTPVACTAKNAATVCSATLSGAAPACNAAGECVVCQSDADCLGPHHCNTATNQCDRTYYAVTPQDFATIYNLSPLFAEGITGKGQTIAVVEDTTITNASDVATFRSAFGLTTATNPAFTGTFKQFTATGTGATCLPVTMVVAASEGEAALDAEWASASAPGAAVEIAACADTTTTYGEFSALQNLVTSASPPQIISMSYGECESDVGKAANQQFVNVYQMAVMAGISVFVSSGDDGAASCDGNGATVAKEGISVSGFMSTPYNVAVGGTDFKDYYDEVHGGPPVTTYWGANNATFGSALSYVPEIPWNDSCASSLIYTTPSFTKGSFTQAYGATGFCNSKVGADFLTTGGGSGGPSAFSKQPSWQTGVVGLPTKSGATAPRYTPDVSLFAADGRFDHFLLYCMTDAANGGGPCTYSNATDAFALGAGGTSFASPAMAGIQALVNSNLGASTGNPNYVYYKLAGAEQGINGSNRCNSSGGTQASPVLPHSECIFNDITAGDIAVNCSGTTNCFGSGGTNKKPVYGVLSTSSTTFEPAYVAGTGWDFATGLGSVNAYNLVHGWSK